MVYGRILQKLREDCAMLAEPHLVLHIKAEDAKDKPQIYITADTDYFTLTCNNSELS